MFSIFVATLCLALLALSALRPFQWLRSILLVQPQNVTRVSAGIIAVCLVLVAWGIYWPHN